MSFVMFLFVCCLLLRYDLSSVHPVNREIMSGGNIGCLLDSVNLTMSDIKLRGRGQNKMTKIQCIVDKNLFMN